MLKYNIFIRFLVLSLLILQVGYAADVKDRHELAGDIIQIAIPVTALGMSLVMEDDYNGTVQFSKSFSSTFVATQVLKYGVNEERPNGGDRSFPSGHTSAAFSGASFIQRRYGWSYGVPAYLAATYVGWTRVYADAHYTHDVIAGALIGIGFTYLFTDPYTSSTVTLEPIVDNGFYGLKYSKSF